jgi:uncharacterized membrane protein
MADGALPDPPPPPLPQSTDNLMLVLSYLGALALIPLLLERENREIQWHAKQGIVLVVLWLGASFPLTFVGVVFFPFAILNVLLFLAFTAISIVAIVKALNGERLVLPGISALANRF